MILSFRCADTQRLLQTGRTKRWQSIGSVAMRKLRQLDAVSEVAELRIPPGNRLEMLTGNRKGQYSIRINDQWRLCFRWENGAHDVEIIDYH
jgi:toxin HigB-1